ncbi:uncharacterized protein [Aegilops tauschii subsp. strangulata]|uniref:uncharacterized protein n=1 Tax=Aegilops tauschii subsp. strangulata TaxID=200361 RepID=UPI000989C8E7|nr:uncharacterized protein LOC109738070 [Aegilops tauschii subsp. strangulata]
MTPFQALYGFPPPMVAESALPDTICEDNENLLQNRELAVEVIKQNLIKAQARMKFFADRNRKEREFVVGDMVYLKIQPHRHTSLSLHRHIKLHFKFYGPFRVLSKIVNHAYKLLVPEDCQLHDTFHVSQLKKHIGPKVVPSSKLPLVGTDGTIIIEPEAILERKLIPRKQELKDKLELNWGALSSPSLNIPSFYVPVNPTAVHLASCGHEPKLL